MCTKLYLYYGYAKLKLCNQYKFYFILVLACVLANNVIADQGKNNTATCTRNTGPIGISPAYWSDPSKTKIALAKQGFNKINFVTRDGKSLVAHIYRPSRFNPKNGPIWFVMHGINRNANDYIKTAAPVAERYQALTIVIEFSRRHYPTSEDYTLGITTNGRANNRAAKEGRYRRPENYLYNEIERVFEAIRLEFSGKQHGYYLFGHSAGAQFTHRMLTFVPCARVLGAVSANAGWYTLPEQGNNLSMPYSLRGGPSTASDIKALLSAPLTLLLGTKDIKGPEIDRNVRKSSAAMAQGSNRLARGKNYFEIGQSLARSMNVCFGWQLVLEPGAGHNVKQVIESAGHLLFAVKPKPSCT